MLLVRTEKDDQVGKPPESITEQNGNDEGCCQRILATANNLITEPGFDKVTMAEIAKRSEITIEQLEVYYSDKQQILDGLVGYHLGVCEGIRAFIRTDPNLSPLQRYQREWELILMYMSNHQATLQAYMQRQTDVAPWIQERIGQQRNQDIELLEEACDLRELQRVNPISLEAVLYGTLWSLILEYPPNRSSTDFEAIPGMVTARILNPLTSLVR
ncbi:MAG: hypothetical protein DRH08_13950 [Deltaproteobacteria bacterium]|nr:MAG: hypothetical protein DRH08_13950 [Deltaproteobacteria bacterium]